jgi:hypothetical protein
MAVLPQATAVFADERCVTPCGLGRSWPFTKRAKATTVTVNGRLVVTLNEVGLAAGLELVSMTAGAARNGISHDLLVRVLADWDRGEVELPAVFSARKAAKPSARAFVGLLASSSVIIFPSKSSTSRLRFEFPRVQRGWHLLACACRPGE